MVGVANWIINRAEKAKYAFLPLTDRLRPLVRCTHPEGTPRVVLCGRFKMGVSRCRT